MKPETLPNTNTAEAATNFIAAYQELMHRIGEELAVLQQFDPEPRPWLTVAQVAEMLNTSESWVYKRIKRIDDPLPALRDGITRINPAALDAWVGRNDEMRDR